MMNPDYNDKEKLMSEPEIAKKGPYVEELEPGDYFWCACGKSADQPFCDGSHKDTDFEPLKFTITEKSSVYLCGCKHSSNPPFCDGSHNKI
jgi:CDGSH-type Zn-finger protein